MFAVGMWARGHRQDSREKEGEEAGHGV